MTSMHKRQNVKYKHSIRKKLYRYTIYNHNFELILLESKFVLFCTTYMFLNHASQLAMLTTMLATAHGI